jgi:hypothetical protein
MRLRSLALRAALLAAALLPVAIPATLAAQSGHEASPQTAHPPAAAPQEPAKDVHKVLGPADIIMPHITDSKHFEYPCVRDWGEWACSATLPRWPVTVGGKTYDFGPTKHVVWMLIAATLTALLLIGAARADLRPGSRR